MMPAASNKTEPKTSPEATDPTSRSFLTILDKKVRNIEKRKSRLDVIRAKKAAGDALEKEQQETLNNYDGVVASLDFARDLQKTFTSNAQDLEKQQKKQLKREKQEKAANDLKRTVDLLQIQATLDALGSENVREHYKTGKHGAVVLTEDNLNSLDEIFKLITPPPPGEANYMEQLNAAGEHINNLLEGKERAVAGSTYKELMDLLHLIIGCGYFERAREAEEEETIAPATETEEKVEEEEETPSVPEVPPVNTEKFTEAPQPEVQAPSAPVQPPSPEVEEPSIPHPAQVLQAAVATHEPPASPFGVDVPLPGSPPLFQPPAMEPPRQPTVHKAPRPLAEIVSQVEGTFSFLQESEIDVDSPHIDPAVVAAQPMMRPPSVPSQQPPQSNIMPAGFPAPPHVDQSSGSEAQDPLSLSQQSLTQSNLDYSGGSQSFAQAGLSHAQNLSSGVVADAMFQPQVEETPAPPSQQQHSHPMMGQALASGESVAQYDLPPSIPLPPSQASQDGTQMTGQEKKFQLNASATEFQSRTMYSQMPLNLQNLSSQPPPPQNMSSQAPSQPQPPHQPNSLPESRPIPPPTTVNTEFPSNANFAQAAGDFSQQERKWRRNKRNISGGGNFQGNYQRGGRGGPGYRGGPRGGRGGNNNGNAMQNGFNNRAQNGNARPGNRGGASFQGYPPRPDYRPDGFQGFNSNGFGGAPYQKRGGAGGPGYNRGGNNRGAGGMRGGVPRGGPPRGAGGNRGGMNRPGNQ